MDLLDPKWLRGFGVLHQGAKRGELDERDLASYRNQRDRLAYALLKAQQIAFQPDQTARRALRVACTLPLYMNFHDRIVRAPAIDISVGGLAAVVAAPPHLTDTVNFRLALPAGEPLHARGRMVYVQQRRKDDIRVGCEFLDLEESEAERLEQFVFDGILERLMA